MSRLVEYNYLGKSGVKVSNICLGTFTFGETPRLPRNCSEKESHTMLDRFIELGGNFIDTADVYFGGQVLAETILGNWLVRQKRDEIILATKVGLKTSDDQNGTGLSRKHILDGVEQSLKRLQTSYIDLYQIHIWDFGTPIEEVLSTLNDLVKSGKVRYVGASNVTGWQLQKIVEICKARGYDEWITLQQQYSLLSIYSELELVDICRNEGIGMLPWSPLKGGWLTGKVKKDALEEGSRVAFATEDKSRINEATPDFEKFNDEKTRKLLALMDEIAQAHGKSVAQVALRWLLQKDFVTSVIIGAKTVAQLEDNMGAGNGWELTKKEMDSLDEASMYEVPYPYELILRLNKPRRK